MVRVPIWVVALVLAALSPWAVRALSNAFEATARRRTEQLLLRARARKPRGANAQAASQVRHGDDAVTRE
jgi:hypothetical protein